MNRPLPALSLPLTAGNPALNTLDGPCREFYKNLLAQAPIPSLKIGTRASTMILKYFPVLSLLLCTTGCISSQNLLDSPYRMFHEDQQQQVHMPSPDSMDPILKAEDAGWTTIDQPIEEVWHACLKVAAQRWGILGLNVESNGVRHLLYVDSHAAIFKIGLRGMTPPVKKLVERWMILSLRPIEDGRRSEIMFSWLSPDSHEALELSPLGPDFGIEGGRGRSEDQQATVWVMADSFLYDLKQMLRPEYHWLTRFPTSQPSRTPNPRPIEHFEEGKHTVAHQLGNYWSAYHRHGKVLLEYPALEERLKEVAQHLRFAAGWDKEMGSIFIESSDQVNAKVTANGDIFITTALLDKAGSMDEIAALMAHELGHFFSGDFLKRAEADERYSTIGGMVGGTTGFVLTSAVLGLTSPTYTNESLELDVSQYLLTEEELVIKTIWGSLANHAILIASTRLIRYIAQNLYDRYTIHKELQADTEATELLWRAGYNHEALASFLRRSAPLEF